MNRSWVSAATLSIVLLAACHGNRWMAKATGTAGETRTNTTMTRTMSPEELGKLGAEIQKHPKNAHEVLARHGLDEKSFERQIRKVTESPEASKRYAEAYRRARA